MARKVSGTTQALLESVKVSFIALTLLFVAVLGGFAYVISDNRALAEEGAEAHNALCALRNYLGARVVTTDEFIRDIELGNRPPIAGFTIAELKRSNNQTRETVSTLATIDCGTTVDPSTTGG